MTGPPRLVLDTSVVLSALVLRGGPTGRLRTGWQASRFVPLVSALTATELVRVLGYAKFALTLSEQEDLLADYLPWTRVVDVPSDTPHVPPCRDVADVPFLHLAIAGRAHALVTGDRDLLELSGCLESCAVMEVAAFCQRHLGDLRE